MHAVSGSLFRRPLGEVSSAVKHTKNNWRWEWKGHWRRGGGDTAGFCYQILTYPKGESIRDSSEGKLPFSDGFYRWQR